MKRLKLIIICLCVALCSAAQTQQILVKTRGAIDSHCNLIPGKALEGVTVKISGGHSPVVSDINGCCIVSLDDSIYTFSRIEKNGYELIDTAIIGRQMKASNQTLVIVMGAVGERVEFENELNRSYQGPVESASRRLLIKSTDDKEKKELYARIITLHKIYQTLLQELKERCYDFDQVIDLDFAIYQNAIAARYTQADSLINLRDEPAYHEQRIPILLREIATVHDKSFLAYRYYQLSESYRILQDYEEGAGYLEKRANLDTLNTEWNLDAGMFIIDYLFDKKHERQALEHLDRAILRCSKDDEDSKAKAFVYKGHWFFKRNIYRDAKEWYSKADSIYKRDDYSIVSYNEKALECVEGMAFSYQFMKEYEEALKLYDKISPLYNNRKDQIANYHINKGTYYQDQGSYDQAQEEYKLAMGMLESIPDKSLLMARCYNNLGSLSDRLEKYEQALDYYKNSHDLYKQIYGPQINIQLEVGYLYNNMAAAYYNQKKPDFQSALRYFTDALNILSLYLDKDHPTIRTLVENIATTNKEMSRD